MKTTPRLALSTLATGRRPRLAPWPRRSAAEAIALGSLLQGAPRRARLLYAHGQMLQIARLHGTGSHHEAARKLVRCIRATHDCTPLPWWEAVAALLGRQPDAGQVLDRATAALHRLATEAR